VYHRKNNRGRLHPPIALAFAYEPDRLTVHGAQLGESPGLRARASPARPDQDRPDERREDHPGLATELDAKEDTVKKNVYRLRDRGVVVQITGDKLPMPGDSPSNETHGTRERDTYPGQGT
jgi:hypothetical protein